MGLIDEQFLSAADGKQVGGRVQHQTNIPQYNYSKTQCCNIRNNQKQFTFTFKYHSFHTE